MWAFFGDGVHPHARRIYETELPPFMSQTSNNFWRNRLWYFSQGLYYQGGMVSMSFPCTFVATRRLHL